METVRLTLNLPPSLEDELVDWLLARGQDNFTSADCFGRGGEHALHTLAERVAGKARRIQLVVPLAAADYPAVIAAVQDDFAGADILYQVVPVLCSGSTRQQE